MNTDDTVLAAPARTADALRAAGVSGVVAVEHISSCVFAERGDDWRVRTPDGATPHARILVLDHDVVRAGITGIDIDDPAAAFRGIATHGLPNLFLLDHRTATTHARYIARCVDLLADHGATRIEVRSAVQHEFLRRSSLRDASGWARTARAYRRAMRSPNPDHYDLTTAADRERPEEYLGPAVLSSATAQVPVSVALGGHHEPIDGQYHWYGRVTADHAVDELKRTTRQAVTLTLPGGAATPARLAEHDPWGNVRVTGVGMPPFPLETLEQAG